MALNDASKINISLKKLSGKAHTSNDKGLPNEGLPSSVTLASSTIFGETIPSNPTANITNPFTRSGTGSYQVEYVRLIATYIPGTDTPAGKHAFKLSLPSDYATKSSHGPTGAFVNDADLYSSNGALQLVPPSFGVNYEAKPYYGSVGSGTLIPVLDDRDWTIDYFNGIFFQQDPPANTAHNPTYVDAFVYIGDYLNTVVAGSGGSANPAGANTQIQYNNNGSFGASSDLTWDGTGLTVNGNANFSEYIYHAGDNDTFIQFADDAIGITAGGEQLITISEAGQDIVKIGDGGDVDFQVRTLGDDNTLYVRGDTDRIGIGTNSPLSIVHVKEAGPTLTLQRENNSNASTINFIGANSNTANSIIHDSSTNDLVFKTFNGSAVEEILRVGDHYGSSNRQVIILSGSGMHAGAMHPRESADIAFFVSGSIGSRGTTTKGTAVFGGDMFVSGSIHGILSTHVLASDDTNLTNARVLTAGDGISISTATPRQIIINSTGLTSRTKAHYDVSPGFNNSTNFTCTGINFSDSSYDVSRIDVYLNGQLLRSGSGYDYVLAGPTDTDGIDFKFDLKGDDVVGVVLF